MVDHSPARSCCSGAETPTSFAERAELGHRRLVALRLVAACSSLALTTAALLAYVGLLPVGSTVAQRLALAAVLLGGPRLLGHIRAALILRRPTAPAAIGLALAAAALAGYPFPVAVVVTTVLALDTRNRHTPAYGASRTPEKPPYAGVGRERV